MDSLSPKAPKNSKTDHFESLYFPRIIPKKTLRSRILKSTSRFDRKNLTEVWIQQIHGPFLDFSEKKRNAKYFFGFKNPDSDFPKIMQPKPQDFENVIVAAATIGDKHS